MIDLHDHEPCRDSANSVSTTLRGVRDVQHQSVPMPLHQPYLDTLAVARHSAIGSGQWTLSHLSTITIVFGKNGSGKSLLLRLLRDADPASRHYVVPERTGELDYQPNYLQQQIDSQQRRQYSNRNFTNEYRRQIVARVQAYFAARGNTRSDQLPGRPEEFEAFRSSPWRVMSRRVV